MQVKGQSLNLKLIKIIISPSEVQLVSGGAASGKGIHRAISTAKRRENNRSAAKGLKSAIFAQHAAVCGSLINREHEASLGRACANPNGTPGANLTPWPRPNCLFNTLTTRLALISHRKKIITIKNFRRQACLLCSGRPAAVSCIVQRETRRK